MAGFKEGSLQLKRRDSNSASDIGTTKIYIGTDNIPYMVDEYGNISYFSGTANIAVSGSPLSTLTSGSTTIIVSTNSGVVSGTYGSPLEYPSFVVDSYGRIISATNITLSAASGSVTSVGVSSTTLQVTNTPITSSGNIIINLSSVGTSGTYTKVTTDVYGRVITGTTLTSADIPQIQATKIGSGNINDSEFEYLDGTSANIQYQINQLKQQSLSGTGAGTINKISKFYTSSSVGDSSITDNGSVVTFSTPISSNNNIMAPNFIGNASTSTSALQSDKLKTGRSFSISGDISSNVVSFDGTGNVVLSTNLSAVVWNKIQNVPVATTSTSGVLTSVDWNKFNTVANNTSAYLPLSGGNLTGNLSANNISASNFYDANFINNKILISTSGNISESTISSSSLLYLSGTSANIQTQFNNLSATNHIHTNKAFLDNINQNLSTSASVSFLAISASTINVGNVSNTEFQYLNTVSANIQTQLTNLSATKADKTTTITAGAGLTGGGNLSSNRTISLATTGTSGTYTKVTTNSYGQVTAGTTLTSADIPQLPATKIGSGNINNTEFEYLNTVSANIQTQLTNLSATKADKTITITAGAGLTGGGNLTTNRTISLATTGTSGIYDKVQTNAYGQVTSGRNLISSDLPSGIDASKIADGSVSNTEFQYLNTVSANIQTQLNNKASTVGLTAYQLRSEKGTSLGYAALDTNSKIYTSSIPDAILGQLKYGGSWNANTNIPTLSSAPSMSGTFFIVNVSGTTRPIGLNPNTSASLWPDGNVEWKVGDWIVSDGTYYDKVDNTDAIYSWNGRLGAVVPAAGDYTATQITNTASGNITATTVQAAINELDTEKVPKTTTITAGTGLTGGGDLTTNRTISLAATGTAGTYTKVTTDAYGRVTAGTQQTSADIPQIPATKIGSGNINNTEFEYLNGLSANAQTQLTNLSALDSQKALKTTTITAGTGLTGGGNLTTNRTIALATTGTAGTYTKVTTNAYGQVTSGRLMISADIPQLPATKIGSGNINNTEFEYLNGVSANIQTQLDGKQPLDSDLTAIAALTTQAYGRSLLTQVDAPTARGTLGLTGWATKTYTNGSTTDVAEGTNQYFTNARVRGTALAGYVVGSNTALAATDTVLSAFGKVQAQINARPGTVTSVGLSATGPLSVSGSPVTGSGTLALGWSGSSSNLVRADGSTLAASTFRYNLTQFISNPNLGSGYIKFASIVIPGGSLGGRTVRWSFDGREIGTNLDRRCILTFAIRREANNAFNAKLYCSGLGAAFTETISVRTNDGITFDFYIDATAGGYCAYYAVTPEISTDVVTNTFVASASMPAYSTVITAYTYGYAHRLVTPRTLTIGSTGKSFDGTASVTWTLAEIGAQPVGSYLTASALAPVNYGTTFESTDPFTGTNRGTYDGKGGVRTWYGAGPFGSVWYNVVDVRHRNAWITNDVFGGELAWGMTAYTDRLAFRSRNSTGTPGSWCEVAVLGKDVAFSTVQANNFNASSLTASSIVVTNSSKNLSTMTNATSSKLFPYVASNSVALTAISTDDISIKSNGLGFAHPHDQWVNTTSSPTFKNLFLDGTGTTYASLIFKHGTNTAGFNYEADGELRITTTLLPNTTNTYNIGGIVDRWNYGYFNNILTTTLTATTINADSTFSVNLSGNNFIAATTYISSLTAASVKTQTIAYQETYVIDTTATEINLPSNYSNIMVLSVPVSAVIILPFGTSPGFQININCYQLGRKMKICPSSGSYLYWSDSNTGTEYLGSGRTNLPYIYRGLSTFVFCGPEGTRHWYGQGYLTRDI